MQNLTPFSSFQTAKEEGVMSQTDKKEEVDTSLRVLVSDVEEVATEVPVVNMTEFQCVTTRTGGVVSGITSEVCV